MVTGFCPLEFLLDGIAEAEVNAGGTNHLHTEAAHATQVIWVTMWFNDDDTIAMMTCEGIRLLTDTIPIEAEGISPSAEHYCSWNSRVPVAVPV